jgi:hypothetical protein
MAIPDHEYSPSSPPCHDSELVHNPTEVMELAMEKGAGMVLLPVYSRRALVDLSDDAATRVQALFSISMLPTG